MTLGTTFQSSLAATVALASGSAWAATPSNEYGSTLPRYPTQSSWAIAFDSTNYLKSKEHVPLQSFNSIEAQVALGSQGRWVSSGLQAQAFYTLGSSLPLNLDVNEAFVATGNQLGAARVSLGRKLAKWSELDDAWKLGIWQPRFFWDPFQGSTSGLIGAFVEFEVGKVSVTAFASGVSFPEHGVPTGFDNGVPLTPSYWSRNVPRSLPMLGSAVPVSYTLQTPDLAQLLVHPSVAVRARYGEDRGWWAAAAYGYKPVNQVQLGMDGFLDIQSSMQVALHPRITSHHVGSVEAGFNSRQWAVALASLWEVPVRDTTPASWTTQELSPALGAGPLVSWRPKGPGGVERFNFGYLLQTGGDAPDQGALADPSQSAFDQRYFYKHALFFESEAPIAPRLGGTLVTGRQKTQMDLQRGGLMFSPEVKVRWRNAVAFAVGADLFAASTQDYAQAGFLGQSTQNSRVYGRMSYGF